jgi:8-oxo-dGTP diphosphatase
VVYVACQLLSGTAYPASPREVAEVAWARREELGSLAQGGIFAPVQAYLDAALTG